MDGDRSRKQRVHPSGADGKETQLSQDGSTNNSYRLPEWSPDSRSLVAWRVEPGDIGMVYLVQSSPPGGGRAVLRERPYAQAGDKFPKYELNIFDVASANRPSPRWTGSSTNRKRRNFTGCATAGIRLKQEDRGHQRLRVIEASCDDGSIRNVVDERTKTFILDGAHGEPGLPLVNWLANSDEIIYVSETDGWRHLYLVEPKDGKIKNQITKGEWVVRGIDRIDEDSAPGLVPRQRHERGPGPVFHPLLPHQFRRHRPGGADRGQRQSHRSIFAGPEIPDRHLQPRGHGRRCMNCAACRTASSVCKLEKADISELKETGWKPPEVFVAKGRDGKTDIWGIIRRPQNFDPAKKYPVLENIYTGPQGAYVPKSFSGASRSSGMTDAGFIVVQCDGMGTANRSKAFHDVCWHNLADGGFPGPHPVDQGGRREVS